MAKRKPKPRRPKHPEAEVASVFRRGKSTRVLLEVSAEVASEIVEGPLPQHQSRHPVEAVEADLDALRERAADVADSALAASALQLARELADPYNSATSKSMCARELRDTMTRLWDLAPEAAKEDIVDELKRQRNARREKQAANQERAAK